MKKTMWFVSVISFIVLAAGVNAAGATAPRDQKDIRALQHAFTTAWDRADAGALAALFTADGDLITPDGTVLVHRDGIESFYAAIFKNGYAGSHGQAHLVRLQFIKANVALVDGEWSITGARTKDGQPREAERGLYAIIAVKTPNGWMIRALREQSSATALSVAPSRGGD